LELTRDHKLYFIVDEKEGHQRQYGPNCPKLKDVKAKPKSKKKDSMSNQPLGINKNEFNTIEQYGKISLVICYNPMGAISKDLDAKKDHKCEKRYGSKDAKNV
jgi:hypothetical protein